MKLTQDNKKITMNTLEHSLKVGSHEGGLDLMCRARLDGVEVANFKGRSFLGQFAYMLHSQIHGGKANRFWGGIYGSNDTISFEGVGISSITYDPSCIITFSSVNIPYNRSNGYLWIHGVRGTSSSVLNGLKRYTRVANNRVRIYELDGVTPVDTTGLSYEGSGAASDHNFSTISAQPNTSNISTLYSWDLIIGRSNEPVDIKQFGLIDTIANSSGVDGLSMGNVSTSTQVTNKPSSRFVLSRSFTNNSGSTIGVNEIGITSRKMGQYPSSPSTSYITLLARDVLDSTIDVPQGSTLSIDYEVIINLVPDTQDTEIDGTNGGFTSIFLSFIRTLATASSPHYVYKRYFNSAGNAGSTSYVDSGREGYALGIRVGSDQTFTSMTDSTLLDIVDHGEQDGELYHYGSDVEEEVEIDEVNQKAVIEMSRIFENRGSIPVTIKEIGWYGNSSSSANLNGSLFARTALDSTDWYTVQPGEYVKIIYKIEVIA